MDRRTKLTAAVAVLLVVSAVLFAIGTAIERSQRDEHAEPAQSLTHVEGEEGGESGEEAGQQGEATGGESGEEIAGVDTESVPAIVLGVAVSLGLAAGLWWRRTRRWLFVVAVFGLVFAAADARELAHQVNESNAGIAVIAASLLIIHLLISALAVTAGWSRAAPVSVRHQLG
jgi:uncharacterized membrane protein